MGKTSKLVRQDKHGRKDNIGIACLATEEQAKLAIKMLNKTKQYVANEYKQAKLAIKMLIKTKQYVANEYKHRKQGNNLNNNTKEKDKRYKKLVEEKQLQETETCYACRSKEHLIKSCKKNTNLFVTNE